MTGHSFELSHPSLTIGRDGTNSIVLPDGLVSRRQAQITESHGVHTLVDLGASNPTLVNGHALSNARLVNGDLVQFGSQTFRYDVFPSIPTAPPLFAKVRPWWLLGGIGIVGLLAVGWNFIRTQNRVVGLWLEPAFQETAMEFRPDGTFRSLSVDDSEAKKWTWHSAIGRYVVDGNSLILEYGPGQSIVGRWTYLIGDANSDGIVLIPSSGEQMRLVRTSILPSREPDENWTNYDLTGGSAKEANPASRVGSPGQVP